MFLLLWPQDDFLPLMTLIVKPNAMQWREKETASLSVSSLPPYTPTPTLLPRSFSLSSPPFPLPCLLFPSCLAAHYLTWATHSNQLSALLQNNTGLLMCAVIYCLLA